MITSTVFTALIGTLLYRSAISAAVNYEPIKITVNENFNSQPGQVFQETKSLEPGIVHQGANFYFKPQLNLPPGYMPPNIEALISSIHQQHNSCAKDTSKVVVEKDKLIGIIKPFIYPLSDIPKETLPGILLENENNVEIVEPPKIISSGLEDVFSNSPKPIIITEEAVKEEESVILEEPTGEFPIIPEVSKPIINYVETKPGSSELAVIPEAPVLPSLSLNDIHFVEEVKVEEPIILPNPKPIDVEVEPKPITSEILVIPDAPVLPPLSFDGISSIIGEEVKNEESIILEAPTGVFPTISEISPGPISEPIINYVGPKPASSELVVIPEAPVLPPLSFNGIPPIIEEEMKKEESIILEEPTGVFPTIPEISIRPISEPIINYVGAKPDSSELVVIPEAPVLPPLSFNGIPLNIEEEVKKEESIILEEPTGVFPTIPEISIRPISEPIINYIGPKPDSSEGVVIPEAPLLPPPSFNGIPPTVEEEVKNEESIILEEPTGVFPTIPEISVGPISESLINDVELKPVSSEVAFIPEAPVLPPLSLHDIQVVEEEVKVVTSISEPVITEVGPTPAVPELVAIPEAPILPPLSLNNMPSVVEEVVKKEESTILEESTDVFSSLPVISVRPISEINNIELKPVISELGVIPEAPELLPSSLNNIHVVEQVTVEEPRIIEVEPKPATPGLVGIPEAPVLPPLSFNGITPTVQEEVTKEESIILEEPTGVFPTIPEISIIPISVSLNNDVELKPVSSELAVIPEAPVLPSLSLNDIHVVEEEVKVVNPITEPAFMEVEPRPTTSTLVAIPEAPVLPPQVFNGISPVVEEVYIDESIKVGESIDVFPAISETSAISKPSMVSETAESFALENNIFPVAIEKVKIEVPILFKESIEAFSPISEISPEMALQEPKNTVLKEVFEQNPTDEQTVPPTFIAKPSNNLGVFSYVPSVSQFRNRAPKSKPLMIPKPASLERFLLNKYSFRLPVTQFSKLSPLKSGNIKQFLLPKSYAHDIVAKRIAPNMAFKKNPRKRVKIYIRSNVPKGPSHL